MKVIRSVVAVVALVALAVTGAFAAEVYKDGRYIGLSDATRRGYVMAIVTVAEGKIQAVRLTEMDGFGRPKPADYPWSEYHEAIAVLPSRFVAANSAEVDGVAGATSTSRMSMQAVNRALLKATGAGEGRYLDGTFFGRSPADPRTYGTALVTIKDDRIVAVVLDEVLLPDYTWKDWATYPHEITVQGRTTLASRFVSAGTAEVDMITGATSSSEKWIAAVQNALRNAER